MPYRVAADVLVHLLPIDAGKSPETLRGHTLQVGEQLGDAAADKPPAAASAITISLDSTFIRSREDGERHLEVRVGNVETLAAAAGVRRRRQGRDRHHRVDPAKPGNRGPDRHHRGDRFHRRLSWSAVDSGQVGVTKPPILDWFHIAMRLQHAKQAAGEFIDRRTQIG